MIDARRPRYLEKLSNDFRPWRDSNTNIVAFRLLLSAAFKLENILKPGNSEKMDDKDD